MRISASALKPEGLSKFAFLWVLVRTGFVFASSYLAVLFRMIFITSIFPFGELAIAGVKIETFSL